MGFLCQSSTGPEERLGIDIHSPVISGAGEAVSDPVPDGGSGSPPSLQSERKDVHKERDHRKVRTHKPKLEPKLWAASCASFYCYWWQYFPIEPQDFCPQAKPIRLTKESKNREPGQGRTVVGQVLLHPKELSQQFRNNVC